MTAKLFGREFEKFDFDLAATVEIVDNDIVDLRKSVGTDVALNTIFVFVHDEEDIGLIEMSVELAVEFNHSFSVSGISRGDKFAER